MLRKVSSPVSSPHPGLCQPAPPLPLTIEVYTKATTAAATSAMKMTRRMKKNWGGSRALLLLGETAPHAFLALPHPPDEIKQGHPLLRPLESRAGFGDPQNLVTRVRGPGNVVTGQWNRAVRTIMRAHLLSD